MSGSGPPKLANGHLYKGRIMISQYRNKISKNGPCSPHHPMREAKGKEKGAIRGKTPELVSVHSVGL